MNPNYDPIQGKEFWLEGDYRARSWKKTLKNLRNKKFNLIGIRSNFKIEPWNWKELLNIMTENIESTTKLGFVRGSTERTSFPKVVDFFRKVLAKNERITGLEFRGFRFDDSTVKQFLDMIFNNTRLKKIDTPIFIFKPQLDYFAEVLKIHQSLEELALHVKQTPKRS